MTTSYSMFRPSLPDPDEIAAELAEIIRSGMVTTAARPVILSQVQGIVYRVIATHLIKKAGVDIQDGPHWCCQADPEVWISAQAPENCRSNSFEKCYDSLFDERASEVSGTCCKMRSIGYSRALRHRSQ